MWCLTSLLRCECQQIHLFLDKLAITAVGVLSIVTASVVTSFVETEVYNEALITTLFNTQTKAHQRPGEYECHGYG